MLHVHVVRTNIIHKLLQTHLQKAFGLQRFKLQPKKQEAIISND